MAEITITNVPTVVSTVASIAVSSTPTSTATGASSSSHHPSYWDLHRKWFAMIIALAIAFVLIAVAGVLIKRWYQRRRDRNTVAFNAGITAHTQGEYPRVMQEVPRGGGGGMGGGGAMYMHDGANDGVGHRQYPVVEREGKLQKKGGVVEGSREVDIARGGTPVQELERGEGGERVVDDRLDKGKGKMVVNESEPVH